MKIRFCHASFNSKKSLICPQASYVVIFTRTLEFPQGMTLEEGIKVISYVYNNTKKLDKWEFFTKEDLQGIEGLYKTIFDLEEYGFSRNDECKLQNTYGVIPKREIGKVHIDNWNKEGVKTLFIIEGDFNLFKKTEFYEEYFPWLQEGVTQEEIQDIYNHLHEQEKE